MQIIDISPLANQLVSVVLAGQNCQISIYQKHTGLFLDLIVDNILKLSCVQMHDGVNIIKQPYLGFVGGLCFIDTQGNTDPYYTGLGDRYLLCYLQSGVDL